jgi:amino acid transporter
MTAEAIGVGERQELRRAIDWRGAFWVASGVPALVLFSIGGIAGTTGKLAFLVWIISMVMGFIQSFTYAEIAGLFAEKSGGAPIYGATAWLRYSKLVGPLSVWCYWFAWSPVLSLGCAIAASYLLNAYAPIPAADSPAVKDWIAAHASSIAADSPRVVEWLAANAGKTAQDAVQALLSADAVTALTPAIRTWDLASFNIPGLATAHLNATFVIGVLLMLIIFAIQHRGILSTANFQKVVGSIVIVTMLVVGIAPILLGHVDWSNFSNLVPPKAAYSAEPGAWNNGGWTLFLGGLFIAAWSTYGFETAVCYTREFKDPQRDTFKAIFYSGLLCLVLFTLVPFTFQGVLGVAGMLAPSVVDGSGIADAIAGMVGGGAFIHGLLVGLMVLALILTIMTAMAGSSRTLYQGSVDGWLPRYLSHVNPHGAPTRAMWTDLTFNVLLLAIASDVAGYFFVLAVSNVGYLIFNFLNLNSGWIHRVDSGHVRRPWKAPGWLIGVNTVLAFVNMVFLGAGAKVWGYANALWVGFAFAALIVPVFVLRHHIQDGGRFPPNHLAELGVTGNDLGERKAGMLPYLALLVGLAVVLVSNWYFQLPA